MKIAILNCFDQEGGAARASFRLHRALNTRGIFSYLVVLKKAGSGKGVIGPISPSQKAAALIRPTLEERFSGKRKYKVNQYFSTASLPFSYIPEQVNALKPDLVHLHWINAAMLSIEDLTKLKAPLVWTLHDMWPFTGGCHYDGGCGNYREACGNCPALNSNTKNDLSSRVFKRKLKGYARLDQLTIVALSRWLKDCAASSRLFAGRDIINLPNPIDLNLYKPMEKSIAKKLLSIPAHKKVLLFGAVEATADPRKGYRELIAALRQVKYEDLHLLVFSEADPAAFIDLRWEINCIGTFSDDLSLKVLYSAADLTVVPSREENLSNIIMESLACGTPVVGFNIGGNPDMIVNGENGYLAEPGNATDLAKCIERVLEHSNPVKLSDNAVLKVKENFALEKVARQYEKLYKDILRKKG